MKHFKAFKFSYSFTNFFQIKTYNKQDVFFIYAEIDVVPIT